MIERFSGFPAYLAERSRTIRLGRSGVPALLVHPDWTTPAPTMIWMHGRTVNKELDPGRYLRWIRAGIAACAVDLPGHGERFDAAMMSPARTLDVLEQMVAEIDQVVDALDDPKLADGRRVFDLDRLGIGGMSAGGMVTLRRLCEEHTFRCAAVEAATGNLAALYHPEAGRPWPVNHPAARVAPMDPMQHLATWRPLPLLVLHTEADRAVPIAGMRSFLDALRGHYQAAGASPDLIRLATWPSTGAPDEHVGFGRYSNDAKNLQLDFLRRNFGLDPQSPLAAAVPAM